MMTDAPDAALLWARKDAMRRHALGNSNAEHYVAMGAIDNDLDVIWSAHGFRAGQAFAQAERDALAGALQDIADLATECVGVPIFSEAAQYWALMTERAIDIARAALDAQP